MRRRFLDPGRLSHFLTLEAMRPSPDGLGGQKEDWQRIGAVWAAIDPVGASSAVRAEQRMARVTHRVTVRHCAGLASGMRFTKHERRFAILSVHDPDESGRTLICHVEEEEANPS